MNGLVENPAFWSAVAAFGSFVTALVIARASRLDRAQQKELAARTRIQPNEASRTSGGCFLWVENKGPSMAWRPEVEVYPAPSEGSDEEQDVTGRPRPISGALAVGGRFGVDVTYRALAERKAKRVGITVHWIEEHGHARKADFEVIVVEEGPFIGR